MRQHRLTIGMLSVGLLAFAMVLASSGLSDAQQPPDALSTCIAENRSLAAAFLVDTSASLQRNDPENERVQAIRSALSALSALDSSTPVAVYVALLDFDVRTRKSFPERPDWERIPESATEHSTMASRFAERNDGPATDYVAALEPWGHRELRPSDEVGALEMLEKAPEGSCRLLVWFTDGQMDLGYHGDILTINWTEPPTIVDSQSVADALWMEAWTRLCSPGGLADRLRAGSDISSGSSAQVSVVALDRLGTLDFELLHAFATGEGSAPDCGSAAPRGTFGTAEDLGALAIGLRSAALGFSHGAANGTRSCLTSEEHCEAVGDATEDYDYTFHLYPGFQRFNLLTLAAHPSVKTRIILPSGTSLELDSDVGVTELDGAKLSSQRLELKDGGTFLVDGELSPGGLWEGHWRVRYSTDDPEAVEHLNRSSIYVFGSLMMELVSHSSLQAGVENSIVFRIAGADGEPAAYTDLETGTQVRVWIEGEPTNEPARQSDGTYLVTYLVPADLADDTALVTGRIEPFIKLSVDSPVIPLTDWTGVLGELFVEPVDPIEVPLQEPDERTGSVEPSTLAKSSAPSESSTSVESSAPGGSSLSDSRPPATTSLSPPVVTATDTGDALLLIFSALTFLVGVLYGANVAGSRLTVGRLAAVEVPVVVSSGTIRRDGEGSGPLQIKGADIGAEPVSGGAAKTRSVRLGNVTVQGQASILPVSKPRAVATVREATFVVGSLGSSSDGKKGLLSPAISGQWIFHTSEDLERDDGGIPQPIAGTLTMLFPFETDVAAANTLLHEQKELVAERVFSAAAAVIAAQVSTAGSDSSDFVDRAHAAGDPTRADKIDETVDDDDPIEESEEVAHSGFTKQEEEEDDWYDD